MSSGEAPILPFRQSQKMMPGVCSQLATLLAVKKTYLALKHHLVQHIFILFSHHFFHFFSSLYKLDVYLINFKLLFLYKHFQLKFSLNATLAASNKFWHVMSLLLVSSIYELLRSEFLNFHS